MARQRSDYDDFASFANLRRAYRWIMSNPDTEFKNFFRDSYAAFAISSRGNLNNISDRLRREIYTPGHASKVFFPKPSGVLRPYTLLSVDDQIVYQACINLVADRLRRRVQKRYRTRTFGHLYAGRSSRFFYYRWQNNYRLYTRRFIDYINDGYNYVANFDLAAFYDSIDHNVLRHFLRELRLEDDVIQFLMQALRIWTSSTWNTGSRPIYHEHGIPQGPQPSGLLSEVVLQHIDERAERGRGTRYLRYVDDIRVLAREERHLRQKLIALDLAAKEIGLFPQTSKINIREVTSVEDEIATVSIPPEPSIHPIVNQEALQRRIKELTRGGRVGSTGTTRFRYLLANLKPSHKTNGNLIAVVRNQPEHTRYIMRHFAKYDQLPKTVSNQLFSMLQENELYHSVHGDVLRLCLGRVCDPQRGALSSFCYERLFDPPRYLIPPQPTYKEALVAWVVRYHRLTYGELEGLWRTEKDWWVRKSILRELTPDYYGIASLGAFLNRIIRTRPEDIETARAAVSKMIEHDVPVEGSAAAIVNSARVALRGARLIKAQGSPDSIIGDVLEYVLHVSNRGFDWRRFLEGQHDPAEKLCVGIKQAVETDIDVCIVRIDSFCDVVLERLFRSEQAPGRYIYGSVLNAPPRVLRAKFPAVLHAFKKAHDYRKESLTAHPRSHRTGRPTRRLKHRDFYDLRPLLQGAFEELEQRWIPPVPARRPGGVFRRSAAAAAAGG